METLRPDWAMCFSVQPPSQQQSVFLCLSQVPCISVCAHCLLSRHRAPLRRAWLPLLYSSCQIFVHMDHIPRVFSAPGQAVPVLCLCLSDRYSSPLIVFVALPWTCSFMFLWLFLLHWGAQHWTQCVPPVLSRGEGSNLSTCWQPSS